MGCYMSELGLSPSARQRLALGAGHDGIAEPLEIKFVTPYLDSDPPKDPKAITIGSKSARDPAGVRITRAPIVIEDADKL